MRLEFGFGFGLGLEWAATLLPIEHVQAPLRGARVCLRMDGAARVRAVYADLEVKGSLDSGVNRPIYTPVSRKY